MAKAAFAIACHPDDIEFGMAGTLIKLKNAGYEIHYMNIANGSLGTNQYDYKTIVAMRREEAIAAAKLIGAHYHESICDDVEVFYTKDLYAQLVPEIREVDPEIILTHGPYDYMEDHINAGRLVVSSAFFRGMTNCKCSRAVPPVNTEVAVYHSAPHSLTDQLRRPVIPGMFVDIKDEVQTKKDMLCCHRSQKDWLDISQGNDAYLDDMESRARYYGKLSGKFTFAEGWIRHNHLGFCGPDFNPMLDALKDDCFVNQKFEDAIKIENYL